MIAILAMVAGIATYGWAFGEGPPAEPDAGRPTDTEPGHDQRDDRLDRRVVDSWRDLPALPSRTAPVPYARALATAVFTWDTLSGLTPADYRARLAAPRPGAVGPSAHAAPGWVADLRRYLPDSDTWRRLTRFETRQSLRITEACVPDQWQHIARTYRAHLAPGTTAVTITAERRRIGVWHGEQQTSTSQVRFTVFVACPDETACYPLRLSILGEVLE